MRILQQRGISVPAALLELLEADPDARVPIALAEEHLEAALRAAADERLGLWAGRSMSIGDCPVIDYAMSTASSVREAAEIAMQHTRLCSDTLSIELHVESARALVRLESSVPLQRLVSDFMMAGLYAAHVSLWPHEPGSLECWFAHPEPSDVEGLGSARERRLADYAEALPGARLRFDAPCFGFSFDELTLDRALRGSDPKLHAIVQKYADLMLSELPSTQTLAGDIRRMLPGELARSKADATSVARKLRVSVRTLGRRLEEEGTSFKVLLNDVRRELAMNMLVRSTLPIADVARQLDFADVTTFHRAFRRWTGQTPASYRASRSSELSSQAS